MYELVAQNMITSMDVVGLLLYFAILYIVVTASDTDHVVYFLILNDLLVNIMMLILRLTLEVMDPFPSVILWYRAYLAMSQFPMTFHDFVWCLIGYVRYLKIVKPSTWATTDMRLLKQRLTKVAWLIWIMQILLVSLVFRLLAFLTESSDIFKWTPLMRIGFIGLIYVISLLASLISLGFYISILKYSLKDNSMGDIREPEEHYGGIWTGPDELQSGFHVVEENRVSEAETKAILLGLAASLIFSFFQGVMLIFVPWASLICDCNLELLVVDSLYRAVFRNFGIIAVMAVNFGPLRQKVKNTWTQLISVFKAKSSVSPSSEFTINN